MLAGSVEPTFGRPFAALFRNNTSRMRSGAQADRQHFPGRGHFQIQRFVDLRFQTGNVVVADVAPVLAQMSRDAVAARRYRHLRRAYRIRVAAAAGVADRGDVVDIDAKAKTIHALAVYPLGLGHRRLRAQLRQYRGQMLEVVDLKIDRYIGEIRRPACHANIVDVAIVLRNDLRDLGEGARLVNGLHGDARGKPLRGALFFVPTHVQPTLGVVLKFAQGSRLDRVNGDALARRKNADNSIAWHRAPIRRKSHRQVAIDATNGNRLTC